MAPELLTCLRLDNLWHNLSILHFLILSWSQELIFLNNTFIYWKMFTMILFCRQLPLIAALLKGKTDFKFGEMRHKNYVLLFTHIQALLENLQPHVFYKDMTSLEDIIGSYFSLIQVRVQRSHVVWYDLHIFCFDFWEGGYIV